MEWLLLLHHMGWHRLLILLIDVGLLWLLILLVAIIHHILVWVEPTLILVHQRKHIRYVDYLNGHHVLLLEVVVIIVLVVVISLGVSSGLLVSIVTPMVLRRLLFLVIFLKLFWHRWEANALW